MLRLKQRTWERRELRKSDRVFVSLNGIGGPVVRPGRYDPKKKTITFDLPQNARSGLAVLFLPGREYREGIPGKEAKCPGTEAKGKDLAGPAGRMAEDFTFPAGVFYVVAACHRCQSRPLCPHGAIKFNGRGHCYVDQEVCLGQRRWNFSAGLEERTCWDCFPPGAEGAASELCPRGLLVKTLSMDPHCCGCCPPARRSIPDMTLKSLCARGAIGGGLKPRYETDESGRGYFDYNCPEQARPGPYEPVHYIVDQNKCTGCMTCYDNIICAQPRMKARIRSQSGLYRLEDIVLEPFPLPEPGVSGLYLGVWGERDGVPYFREIRLEFGGKRRLKPDRKFSVSPGTGFMIYQKGDGGFKLPLDSGLRPALGTADLWPALPPAFKMEIRTRIGIFTLALERTGKNHR